MTRSTDPLRYFKSSPEVIRPVVMMSVHYPLSLRNVTDRCRSYGAALKEIGACLKSML